MDQIDHQPDLFGPRQGQLSFLRPQRSLCTAEEKREAAAARQARYVKRLQERADAPAAAIGMALLASLATAESFDQALDAPIVRGAIEKLRDAGCSIPAVHRRIKSIRKRLKRESPGDAAERKRRREAKPNCETPTGTGR
jgi:hypothetical protein